MFFGFQLFSSSKLYIYGLKKHSSAILSYGASPVAVAFEMENKFKMNFYMRLYYGMGAGNASVSFDIPKPLVFPLEINEIQKTLEKYT